MNSENDYEKYNINYKYQAIVYPTTQQCHFRYTHSKTMDTISQEISLNVHPKMCTNDTLNWKVKKVICTMHFSRIYLYETLYAKM